MPTARLIDINYLFERCRDRAVMCLGNGNYSGAIDAVLSMNNCLPKFGTGDKSNVRYRVVISDDRYQELTRVQYKIQCVYCDVTQDYNADQVHTLEMPTLAQIASGSKTYQAWLCPGCNQYTAMEGASMIVRQRDETSVLGVMPKPPKMGLGVVDHTTYHIKMAQWIGTMFTELTDAAGRYRDDNWERSGMREGGDVIRLDTEGDV